MQERKPNVKQICAISIIVGTVRIRPTPVIILDHGKQLSCISTFIFVTGRRCPCQPFFSVKGNLLHRSNIHEPFSAREFSRCTQAIHGLDRWICPCVCLCVCLCARVHCRCRKCLGNPPRVRESSNKEEDASIG